MHETVAWTLNSCRESISATLRETFNLTNSVNRTKEVSPGSYKLCVFYEKMMLSRFLLWGSLHLLQMPTINGKRRQAFSFSIILCKLIFMQICKNLPIFKILGNLNKENLHEQSGNIFPWFQESSFFLNLPFYVLVIRVWVCCLESLYNFVILCPFLLFVFLMDARCIKPYGPLFILYSLDKFRP